MRVSPWHSKLPTNPRIYHAETSCTEGYNIEWNNRIPGTGGRRQCERCRRISGYENTRPPAERNAVAARTSRATAANNSKD